MNRTSPRRMLLMRTLFLGGLALSGAVAPADARAQQQPGPGAVGGDADDADLVLRGGKILLADEGGTLHQALAVRGETVVLTGDDAAVLSLIGPDTRVIELDGALVTPGFNDAHLHFASGGMSLLELDLHGTTSLAEIERRVAEAAAAAEPGDWIEGRGWDHTRLPESELGPGGWPTRAALDRAAPDNPVYVERVDGHTGWANTRALEIAEVDADTPDPEAGEIVRDPETGEPTGILKEAAQGLVERAIPEPETRRIRAGIEAAMELAARTGVTSATTAANAQQIRLYRTLREDDELTVRLYAWLPLSMRNIEAFERTGITAAFGDPWLRVGLLKGYVDGTLGSRTAWMLEPFADDPSTRGIPSDAEEIESLVRAAHGAGLQLALHAIGDAANRAALDAVEAAQRASGTGAGAREARHRIEHAQILDSADIPRFGELGVIASMQPTHATSDMRWVADRIGEERAREGAYVWRTLLDQGATVAFGTDFAVEPMEPVQGIYSAVTRQSREEPGTPPGGWLPEQRLTRTEAIRLYTAMPAYAEFQEEIKGTLEPGMLADLVVWDRDLLEIPAEEILEAAPTLTMVGGRVVYESAGSP